MQKKILLGIVCALAIAGLAGIGVMKAGIGATDKIVNVGPFDGGLSVTAGTSNDTTIALTANTATGKSTITYTKGSVNPPAITGLANGTYAVSGNLVFTPPAPATGVNQSFAGLMTTDGTSVTALQGVLTPGYDTATTFTLDKAITVTFVNGVATLTGTSVQATTPGGLYTITGTLKMNDIEGAKKAVENSTGLSNPTISVAVESYVGDTTGTTVGVYRAENRTFYLRNSNDTGVAHAEIPYGNPGDVPLVFKGTAQDGIAVYRPSNTTVYLDSNNDGVAEKEVKLYLQEGDVVLGGTYTGSGATTTINSVVVYRPSTRAFYTDNGDGLLTETPVVFGNAGDTPFLVDGAKIGVYRASNQTIYVDSDLDGVANTSSTLAFAKAGDIPVYDGTNYGLYRPNTATFTFRVGGNDVSFVYGNPDDKPLVGDWQVKYWKTY